MNLRPYLALAALTQVVGCASIVSGANQSVTVETRSGGSSVAGATCKLVNDKGTWYVTTPGSTTVHRSYENLGISCQKAAYEPGTTSATSSTKGMAFGNILFGGLIGVGVDVATGSAYDYPALITVALEPGPQPAGTLDQILGARSTVPSQVAPTASFVIPDRSPVPHSTLMGTAGGAAGAERLAKDHRCAETPYATLFSKSTIFETYTVPCANGTLMAVRCEFGKCVLLQ
ncbi:hypothetical protein [Variovorax sp. WS11]|uniref:hypothetical protein n=1 Tax=Variovorax sp. WS11 TaxID=1105204 RepID=UPI0015E6DBA2|nr:hypothetical protein [Variovorax sp. WS11]